MSADKTPAAEWKYIGACGSGECFTIHGINVWNHEWIPIPRNPSPPPTGDHIADLNASRERVTVKDPTYGEEHIFDVYEIVAGEKRIVFAAGEFSNTIFGFYVKGGDPERMKFLAWLGKKLWGNREKPADR